METTERYMVQVFDKSINDWFNSEPMNDWDDAIDDALNQVVSIKSKTDEGREVTDEYKNEVVDAIEAGQNWCIGECVIGITCIDSKDEYDDVVILVKGIVLDENDIKAIKIPFESYDFLCGYMKRTCEVFGGEWKVYSVDDYFENKDNQFNGSYHAVIKTKVKHVD